MIAEKTGWSKEQILNDHSFAELNFMLADAPRLLNQKKKKEPKKFNSDDELAAWFGTSIDKNNG